MKMKTRDIFLSHRELDKDFVRRLAADIEQQSSEQNSRRRLQTWLDEAEIRPGQSIPAAINEGLEKSRFVALILTPNYFQSESGWTDAEWHAILSQDPDNRRGHILPILAADCPYIPMLLRHLAPLDMRGKGYEREVERLLAILRDEPLPRPTTYRGQAISPNGRIDRATLVAERAVPDAEPDVFTERLYCNLLPVEKLPQHVYVASIASEHLKTRTDGSHIVPSKEDLKNIIRRAQEERKVEKVFSPAFRIVEDTIVTFHDLEHPENPFTGVIDDDDVEAIRINEVLQDENDRRVITSLLNMSVSRHACRAGLVSDDTKKGRFFFPPGKNGANVISWMPKRTRARRTVAKPLYNKNNTLVFWRHQGAYLQMLFLANKFYLKIEPTWVLTKDGKEVMTGPDVGRHVIKWTGPERNLMVLYHVRFWTTILQRGGGPISIWTGDQRLELSPIPAQIQQTFGVAHDQKDLMRLLDDEATLIAEDEEDIADRVSVKAVEKSTGIFIEDDETGDFLFDIEGLDDLDDFSDEADSNEN